MPEDFEISKIKAGKPKGSSHVNVNPTIDAPKTQGGDTPAKQTLNRIAKPVKLKEANFSPAASVMFAQKGTLARVGIQNAPAAKSPASSSKLPKMMTGPKTARSYARRLARITPAHSVQRTTQGTSLPGANFMASETKNEEVDVKKWPQGPNNTDPLASTEMKSAMASASMKTLKQNLQWALKKDNLDHTVDPDTGEAQEQLAGAPYNKSDGGPKVDHEELVAHAEKTAKYQFEGSTVDGKKVTEAADYDKAKKAVTNRAELATSNRKHLGSKGVKDKLRNITLAKDRAMIRDYKARKKNESEEPLEEISDELLYRAQSKAQYLRDKAGTAAKKAKTKHFNKMVKAGVGHSDTPEYKSYRKNSVESNKRHQQALKFWRARDRQGSFKPHKEVD